MKKKRTIGVTILGLYVIIFGLGKLFLVNATRPAQDIIVGNLLALIMVACGIGILLLVNHARLCAMAYFATSGVISIISYCYGLADTIVNFKAPGKDPSGYTPVDAIIWIVVMIILLSVFYFIPALLLHSAKVREQFKQHF